MFVPFIHAFGGVERLILGLSRHLAGARQDHVLLCFEDGVGLQEYADWPMTVHALKPSRSVFSESWALHRALRSHRRATGFRPLLFDLKSAFYAGVLGGEGHLLHFTDPPSLLGSEITKHAFSFCRDYVQDASRVGVSPVLRLRAEAAHRLTTRGVRRSSRVIVMTERISKEIRDLYGVTPVIHRPGVTGHRFRASMTGTSSALRILSVSRLEKAKNLSWTIRALKSAFARRGPGSAPPSWSLEFVGAGSYERELRHEVRQAGLADRVVFHGQLPDDALPALYAKATVVVIPAVQGYGLPALEALACRIPVVLNRASGVSEVLAGTPWVELSDDDEESFAAALQRMLSRIRLGGMSAVPLPMLPTEEAWAESVCRACGWREPLEQPPTPQPAREEGP
jgi:glycosyltransferase involved in cell wall biosynthesis